MLKKAKPYLLAIIFTSSSRKQYIPQPKYNLANLNNTISNIQLYYKKWVRGASDVNNILTQGEVRRVGLYLISYLINQLIPILLLDAISLFRIYKIPQIRTIVASYFRFRSNEQSYILTAKLIYNYTFIYYSYKDSLIRPKIKVQDPLANRLLQDRFAFCLEILVTAIAEVFLLETLYKPQPYYYLKEVI